MSLPAAGRPRASAPPANAHGSGHPRGPAPSRRTHDPAPSGRLRGIEALRGLAATAVVLSHAAGHVDKAFGAPWLMQLFRPGHAGVDLFFAISGFIILFVHRPDVGRPERLGRYLSRRVTRVLPPYWVALAVTVLMGVAGGHPAPSVGLLLRNAALLPVTAQPLLDIAWTLLFEAVFYAVFAVLVLSRVAGLAALAGWLGWIVLAAATGHGTAAPMQFWGFYGVEFFMGMLAAWRLQAGAVPAPRVLALLGLGLFLAACVAESAGLLEGGGRPARLAFGLPAALLVLGLAAAERQEGLRLPRLLRVLGDASYSIYLFQFVFIGAAWQLWRAAGVPGGADDVPLFLVLTVAALLGGVAASHLVERPLLRALRPRRRVPASGSAGPGGVDVGNAAPGEAYGPPATQGAGSADPPAPSRPSLTTARPGLGDGAGTAGRPVRVSGRDHPLGRPATGRRGSRR